MLRSVTKLCSRWLRSARLPWAAAVTAIVLCLPSLGIGLAFDDFAHRQFVLDHLHGGLTENAAWWDMFDLHGRTQPSDVPLSIFAGALPWWTSPSYVAAFLRPLAAATHYVDYQFWPEHPWLMHLQNLVWYALAVLAAGTLYRGLLGSRAIAGLATVMYAIDEAHAEGVAWIAARNTLMTALFVLLTLLAWDRARRVRARGFVLVSALALLCAHASSEGGIAVWPYLLAYAVLLDHGTLRARLLALVPLATVTLGWLGVTAAGGYRLRGGACYVDPRADPALFARVVVERFPEVLRAQFGLPLDLEHALSSPSQHVVMGASYAFFALTAVVAVALLRHRPVALFFALGALGSGVLVCASLIEPRLLFIVGIGGHGLVAEIAGACVNALRSQSAALERGARALVLSVLLALHVPVAAAVAPYTPQVWAALQNKVIQIAVSLPHGAAAPNTPLIVLNTPSYLLTAFLGAYASVAAGAPRVVYTLGASTDAVKLSRPELNTLVLEPAGGYLREVTSQAVRKPSERFAPGQVVQVVAWRIVVERITRDGRPARVRVEIPNPEDPLLTWVAWSEAAHGFAKVALPAVGHSLWLAASAPAN